MKTFTHIAASTLAFVAATASAADDSSLFAGRGANERLSLSYAVIQAGAEKPFSVLHVTDGIWAATRKFWAKPGTQLADVDVSAMKGERLAQSRDTVTRGFIEYLKSEPLLKAILAGHVHLTAEERFSPTAVQYVTGGNFLFCAREVLVF